VIVHTNLGRAPLARAALERIDDVARGYSNLEYDLTAGTRGSRQDHVADILRRLTGAEAALVVNNNAAAVMLALAALAEGRDVFVSRGELIEIGDGFRIPEVLARSGARLREVGTTNRTRAADYENAITPDTAVLLRVHQSNFRVVGFTEQPTVPELVAVAQRHNLPLLDDLGSGALLDLSDEPTVRGALGDGADLVCFSGDKLLGGPQAGIIVGTAAVVSTIARHPLARAMRADKVTLALLQSVASSYLSGNVTTIPFWRMATATVDELRVRAEGMARAVPGVKVIDTEAAAGGGSLPGLTIPSVGIALEAPRADALHARLREQGVVARVDEGMLVCDLRTIDPDDDTRVVAALRVACA
jgi:L-seryl-tRNA(Ser) seleniumtransferase